MEYDRRSTAGNLAATFLALYFPLYVRYNSEERTPPMSSTISGNLHVANDVLADLVGNAAMECYTTSLAGRDSCSMSSACGLQESR